LPRLRLPREAEENLGALPAELREAVAETIQSLAVDHESVGKPLVGRLSGLWSARVGNYRVLYTVERSQIVVRAVRHRVAAYPRRRNR